MSIDSLLLFPYYITLAIRNKLYDKSIKKSYKYDIPIISVGNITVGGTGKTPHSELIIKLLKNDYRIALISRGYKRKSKGFREVQITDSYLDAGDEPLQIKKKYPDITVVVDSSRKNAIETLLRKDEGIRPTLIILDDAFQHRKVTPSLSILLVDYSRPIDEDRLLPIGRLRDLPSQIERANIIIVTKVPDLCNIEETRWRKKLKLTPDQLLLFSKIVYLDPKPLSEKGDNRYIYSKSAILFTGIANNSHLLHLVQNNYISKGSIHFPDHHSFSNSDIKKIDILSSHNPTSVIITTEKDAQRLSGNKSLTENLMQKLFYLPIEPSIIPTIKPDQKVIQEEIKEIGESQFKAILKERL